ncbi:MAG: oxaloacetate decarboxylase, gamma subunit [Treponematales bacterium]|jgi:oxaloacetate decarboxylase gamma subunit
MTIGEMLSQSGVLTLLGMGIVFSFLILLIICVTLLGKVIHAAGADRDAVPAPAQGGGAAKGAAQVAAAVTAAVKEYRTGQ